MPTWSSWEQTGLYLQKFPPILPRRCPMKWYATRSARCWRSAD